MHVTFNSNFFILSKFILSLSLDVFEMQVWDVPIDFGKCRYRRIVKTEDRDMYLYRVGNTPRIRNTQMIMTDNLGYRWLNHRNLNDSERFTSPRITGRGAHPAVRYTPKPQQSDQEYIRCNLDRANGPALTSPVYVRLCRSAPARV